MLIRSYDSPEGGHPEIIAAIPAAKEKDIYFEFSGGVGDIISSGTLTAIFSKLDALKPGDRAVIVLFCHNPDAPDLFLYHPLASQFIILSLGFHDVFDQTYRMRHGLPLQPSFRHGVSSPPLFVPNVSENDLKVISAFPKKFVAFSVTASNGKHEGRSIPQRIFTSAAAVCLRKGITPLFLGKHYGNTILGDYKPSALHTEADPPSLTGVVSAIDLLTMSGSIECARRSVANVVCNSAIMHASWRMRRPTMFICTDPEWADYKACEHLELNGYGYGLVYPENSFCSHSGYTDDLFSKFLDRVVGAE